MSTLPVMPTEKVGLGDGKSYRAATPRVVACRDLLKAASRTNLRRRYQW